MRVLQPLSGAKASWTFVAVIATAGAGWAAGQHLDVLHAVTSQYAAEQAIQVGGIETSALQTVGAVSGDAIPPTFSRVVIDKTGVSRIDGIGAPGSQVLIKSQGRVIGAAVVAANGRWAVALERGLAAGDHSLASVAAGRENVRLGDEVRVYIPPDFTGQEVVAYDRATSKQISTSTEPTIDERAAELASEASKRFSAVVPDTKATITTSEPLNSAWPVVYDTQHRPASDFIATAETNQAIAIEDKLGRSAHSETADAEFEIAQAEPTGDQSAGKAPPTNTDAPSSFDPINTVRGWLKDASETYQRDVAGRLSIPTNRTPVNKDDTPDVAAKKVTDEIGRSNKALEDAEARAVAEAAERERIGKAEAEKKAAAEAEAAAVREREAQAEADRKAAEAQALEAAKRAEDERLAAEKKADDAKAAEAAAKAQQRDTQPALDNQDPPISAEVKPDEPKPGIIAQAKKLFFEIDEGSVRDTPLPPRGALEEDDDLRKLNKKSLRQREEEEERRAQVADAAPAQEPRKLEFSVAEPKNDSRGRVTGWRERSYDNDGDRAKPRASCGKRTKVRKGRRAQVYIVQDGETLWSLARRYYGSGTRYNKIYRANQGRMPSPHVVRPCQRIILPGRRTHAFLLQSGNSRGATLAELDNGDRRQ